MHWVGGILMGTVTVIGAIVLTNVVATRALGTRPVGLWGSK
jgi:hypothetical protein